MFLVFLRGLTLISLKHEISMNCNLNFGFSFLEFARFSLVGCFVETKLEMRLGFGNVKTCVCLRLNSLRSSC